MNPTADTAVTLAQPMELHRWYGEPMQATKAIQLLEIIHRQGVAFQNEGYSDAWELIALFWLQRDYHSQYVKLIKLASSQSQQAIAELTMGQLYCACKYHLGPRHLNKGFLLATALLSPRQYFEVLHRHQLLEQVAINRELGVALSLDDLLQEAKIIQRLQGRSMKPFNNPSDTLG